MYRDCCRVPSQSRLSAVPALPKGEPRGGRCPPSAEGSRRKSGGAAALGSPYGGSGERTASLRGRTQSQIWNMYLDCSRVPSQSRLAPCQLSQRESQGAGFARPAQRVRRCEFSDARPAQRVSRRKSGGAAALGSPYGGAGERTASLRGRRQWQICSFVRDCSKKRLPQRSSP